jgi:hypothetical protein
MKRRRWVASFVLLAVAASSAEVLVGQQCPAAEVELGASAGGMSAVSGSPLDDDASLADDCACLCPCTCANAQLVVVAPVVQAAIIPGDCAPLNLSVAPLPTRPQAGPPLRPPIA